MDFTSSQLIRRSSVVPTFHVPLDSIGPVEGFELKDKRHFVRRGKDEYYRLYRYLDPESETECEAHFESEKPLDAFSNHELARIVAMHLQYSKAVQDAPFVPPWITIRIKPDH